MNLALVPVTRPHAPDLGDNVEIAISIYVGHLNIVSAETRIHNHPFLEVHTLTTHILKEKPAR